jgi:hypothetical protein
MNRRCWTPLKRTPTRIVCSRRYKIESEKRLDFTHHMECPICFENNTPYFFKGCCHSVCVSCSRKMARSEQYQIQPFGPYIHVREKFSRLECPLCRSLEPHPITREVAQRLKTQYPDKYHEMIENIWLAHACGCIYRIKLNCYKPSKAFTKWSAPSALKSTPYIPSRVARTPSVRIVRP